MTWDEIVRSLDTSDKGQWRAAVHELLTGLPASRPALLAGLLDDHPIVRAGCAAALDPADRDDAVEEALRRAGNDEKHRAAMHLASSDLRRGRRWYGERIDDWQSRVAERELRRN